MRKGRLPSFTARTVASATLLLIVVTVLAPRERGVAAFPAAGPRRGRTSGPRQTVSGALTSPISPTSRRPTWPRSRSRGPIGPAT